MDKLASMTSQFLIVLSFELPSEPIRITDNPLRSRNICISTSGSTKLWTALTILKRLTYLTFEPLNPSESCFKLSSPARRSDVAWSVHYSIRTKRKKQRKKDVYEGNLLVKVRLKSWVPLCVSSSIGNDNALNPLWTLWVFSSGYFPISEPNFRTAYALVKDALKNGFNEGILCFFNFNFIFYFPSISASQRRPWGGEVVWRTDSEYMLCEMLGLDHFSLLQSK